MKNILFVCTGNSARSIIAESIINNVYFNKYKAFSAGSKPTGEINKNIKLFLENQKDYNLTNYYSKSFKVFIEKDINIDHVITVCNSANKEVCPIWPKNDQIVHWDIEDPVSKFKNCEEAKTYKIINETFVLINEKIENWINDQK